MSYLYGQQPSGQSSYPGAPTPGVISPGYGGQGLPTPYGGGGVPQYGVSPTGYSPGMHSGVPIGADPTLWQWFSMADNNRSGSITADELQQCLSNGDFPRPLNQPPFDLETVRMLMGLFDTDRNGTITFNEFASVYKYLKEWQGVFLEHDADRSGAIDRKELKSALKRFGYSLNSQLLHLILYKFQSGPSSRAHPQPEAMTFDRFVRACVTVKSLSDAFARLDTMRTGNVTMNYDTFMATVLSSP